MTESSAIPTAKPTNRRSATVVRVLLILSALVGVFICAILVRMTAAAGDTSITDAWCRPTATIDCGHVLASRWAKIGVIPTSALGLLYFGCAAVWFAVIGIPNRRGRAWQLIPIGLIGIGLLGSAAFLFIMSRLPVWCTWCAAAHATNLALFILAIVGWFVAKGEGPARPSAARAGVAIGAVALVGLVLLLGDAAYRQQMAAVHFQTLYLEAVNDVDYIVSKHAASPQHDIPIRTDDLVYGRLDAPHTVVVFSDFQCDACAQLHRKDNLLGIVNRFPDDLRVVFKHDPMCRECNDNIPRTIHAFACDAAYAAEAARIVADRTKALEYWHRLFNARNRFDENPYVYLAKAADLDLSKFEEARRSDAARRRVKEDVDLAHRLGVEGTPTLFLDGRRLLLSRIVEGNRPGVIDKSATLRLWERLLHTPSAATSQPAH